MQTTYGTHAPTEFLVNLNLYVLGSKRKWELCAGSATEQRAWYDALRRYDGQPEFRGPEDGAVAPGRGTRPRIYPATEAPPTPPTPPRRGGPTPTPTPTPTPGRRAAGGGGAAPEPAAARHLLHRRFRHIRRQPRRLGPDPPPPAAARTGPAAGPPRPPPRPPRPRRGPIHTSSSPSSPSTWLCASLRKTAVAVAGGRGRGRGRERCHPPSRLPLQPGPVLPRQPPRPEGGAPLAAPRPGGRKRRRRRRRRGPVEPPGR